MYSTYRVITYACAFTLCVQCCAWGWGRTGHKIINRKAPMQLPASMASFAADSLYYENNASNADIRRDNSDTSFYSEWPRHFIDIDDYPNFHNLSHNLNTVIQSYGWERVKDNGINPWATTWVMDSLTAQLARGDIAAAKSTASDLGHYVGDAHQPLHCTRNYDGFYTGNSGIHARYETNMINTYSTSITIHPDSIHYVSSVVDFAFEYIYHSNSLVSQLLSADTYAKSASGWAGSGTPPAAYYSALWEKTNAFTQDQFQRATQDLASLWYTAWVNAGLSTDVSSDKESIVRSFELLQNYPNPFNPSTTITYQLPWDGNIQLRIYNLLGEEITTLVNTNQQSGNHEVFWNASNISSGFYLYRLTAQSTLLSHQQVSTVRRMLLLK